MQYAALRGNIKTGDMLLWRHSKGGALRALIERWLVRHFTGAPQTHVGIALVQYGRVCVMDMTTYGCAPRPLSEEVPFDWAPSPRELSEEAVTFAYKSFGRLRYSRWRAILAALRSLRIGSSTYSECAEWALSVWAVDAMAPTDEATPGACAAGALEVWGAAITAVQP